MQAQHLKLRKWCVKIDWSIDCLFISLYLAFVLLVYLFCFLLGCLIDRLTDGCLECWRSQLLFLLLFLWFSSSSASLYAHLFAIWIKFANLFGDKRHRIVEQFKWFTAKSFTHGKQDFVRLSSYIVHSRLEYIFSI